MATADGSRISSEQRVLGLSIQGCRGLIEYEQEWAVTHEAPCEGQLLPLTERHVTPAGPGRPELSLESRHETCNDILGSRALDSGDDRGLAFQSRQVAQTHSVPGSKLKSIEVLECAGEPRAPVIGGHPAQGGLVDQNRALGGLVHLGEQLDQRALSGAVLSHNGDHGSGGQRE